MWTNHESIMEMNFVLFSEKEIFPTSARYTSYTGEGVGPALLCSLILKPIQRHWDLQAHQAQHCGNRKEKFFKWIIKCNYKRGPPFTFGSQVGALRLWGKQLHILNIQYCVCVATSQAHRVLEVHKWLCWQKSCGQGDQIPPQNISTPGTKASPSPWQERSMYSTY